MRIAKVIGVVLALAIVAIGLRMAWVNYEYPVSQWTHHAVHSSALVRWWRCRASDRPQLLASKSPWRMTYSWAGGMGPGSVVVAIESNGQATVTTRANGDAQDQVTLHHVDSAAIGGLGSIVDRSGLLCQSSELRKGYRVFDIGRHTIEVTMGTTQKSLFIDECHTVPDGAAFGEVAMYVQSLHAQLRDEVSWGPYGAASMPDPCRE